ncbi:MAG TPA: DUF6152 family protein [Vicinamibacterales bacterium]|jgi:Family of unknown function (DUF6152)|nr:DUF6152 family protein [Vicinamibacterales bacterium]
MTRSLVYACTCALVLATSVPVVAHHSAAGIDRTKTLVVAGTVKEFRWTNPHSWIDLDVTNDKGETQTWSVEMTSPAFLLRAGWKRSTLQTGDKVSVTLRPFRNGDPGGLFVSVTLPDGRVLGERPAAPPQP